MNKHPIQPASRRPVHEQESPPHTWGGLVVYAAVAALIPVTLYALAHPLVVAATIAGVTAGLLARPLHQKLTRRANPSRKRDRQSTTVEFTVAKD